MEMVSRLRSLTALVIFAVAVFISPQIVRAQPSCWGSSLIYILRDEQGKLMDADHDDLWIGPGWQIADYDFGESWVNLPEAVRTQIRNLKFLAHIEKYEPCHFTKPIELRLTLHGKSMNLVFHAENRNYVIVDSLRFQPGTFEHQLSSPRGRRNPYSAEDWKKTGDNAEAVAKYPIAFVRGRVLDSVTTKPITNARVILRSDASYHDATANTDARGLFSLKVRADNFEKASGLAVIVTHPDYLDDYAIAVENRKGGLLQSVANVNVKLVRAVIVSGRVIDEKTGVAPSPKNEIELKAEYPGSKDLWGSKIGGETEYVAVKPDGTFSIKTGIGKNRLRSSDPGSCYHIKDDQRELDIGPQGRSELVLALTTSPGCRPFVKVDPKVLDQYVGEYQMPASAYNPESVIKVFRVGDALMIETNGHREELLPYSDTEFTRETTNGVLRFVRDAQGKVTHIDWVGTIVKKIK